MTSSSSMKDLLKNNLLKEIFRDKTHRPLSEDGKKFAWAVLVLDETTSNMLQLCMQVHEIMAENIAYIELMDDECNAKVKDPIDMHAIYFLSPSNRGHRPFQMLTDDFRGQFAPDEFSSKSLAKQVERDLLKRGNSIKRIMRRLKGVSDSKCDESILKTYKRFRKFRSATVYFARPYEEKYRIEFEREIGKDKYQDLILHFGVLKCAFLPLQSSAFTLGHEMALKRIFFSSSRLEMQEVLKSMSDQLASLWHLFEQYPTLLVRKASPECMEFSRLVKLEMEKRLKDYPTSTDSFLLILDRGMDLKTPLIHDMALQPLIYDLLPQHIQGHFYSYKESNMKYEILLHDENEHDWQNLKHLPLPKVLTKLQEELSQTIKRGPNKSCLLAKNGFNAYNAAISPLRNDLETFLLLLDAKPLLAFSQIESYKSKIQATCDQLTKTSKDGSSEAFLAMIPRLTQNLSQSSKALTSIIDKSESLAKNDESSKLQPQIEEIKAVVKHLKWLLTYFGERLKITDLEENQLELAYAIGKMLSNRELNYFKSCHVHLAVACLEELRRRDLYELLAMELFCFDLSHETETSRRKSRTQELYLRITELFQAKPTLLTSDKMRIVCLFAICSDLLKEDQLNTLMSVGNIPSQLRRFIIPGFQKLGGKFFSTDCPSMAAIEELKTLRRTQRPARKLSEANGSVMRKLAQSITQRPENPDKDQNYSPLVADLADALISLLKGERSALLGHFKEVKHREKSWESMFPP